MEPFVSVVIPVYNVEKYLKECVDSVLNQSYKNMEILLIDDGSTDSSPDICDYYCTIDDRVKCFHKANGGPGSARNIGIRNAKGHFIYFLDSDDYIDHSLLSSVIPYMIEENLDLCFFSAEVLLEDGKKMGENTYIRSCKYEPKDGKSLFIQLRKNNEYIVSNCLFITRKDLIDRNHLLVPEGVFYEDNFFLFQLMMVALNVGVINKPFYFRRVHANSIMTHKENYEKKVNSALTAINQFASVKTDNEEINSEIVNISRPFCAKAMEFAYQSKDKTLIGNVKRIMSEYKYFGSKKLRIKKILFFNLKVNPSLFKDIKMRISGQK